jgi:hypothetical protein
MKILTAWLAAFALAVPAGAQEKDKEKDIFNYAAQARAGKDLKKIVFIAGVEPHGPKGNHEFRAGAIYLARTLNATYPKCYAVVHPNTRWPKDLSHADCVIVLLNGGDKAANDPAVKVAMERGAGFMAVHWGVEVVKGKASDNYLKWMGGYFESHYSVNPFWTPKFEKIPEHETTRGVKPFELRDEWYYHMRFVDDMKGVTPILSAVAPLKSLSWNGKESSPRGGNAAVEAAVKAGKPQHVAWAYVRPDGGRGFGFTGFHNYDNLKNDSFRTLLLNAAAWTSKLEVPAKGIVTPTPTADDMEKLYQDGLRMTK